MVDAVTMEKVRTMEKRMELAIAYAMSRAVAAKSGAGYTAWYEAAGKFDDAYRAYRAGFADAAWRLLRAARQSAAFAESMK